VTLTVAENNQFNLQVNSTGNLRTDWNWNDWLLPVNPPGMNISWNTYAGSQLPLAITFKIAESQNILAVWNNNRIRVSESGVLSTFAAAASASGTATWFFAKGTSSPALPRIMAGTVGLTGSGADLELDDVNIVQGKTYGISNLRFQMPTVFEY
jgi:hypothetical protein